MSVSVVALVDTNILVYRFDARFPDMQRKATAGLRRGLAEDAMRIPHQLALRERRRIACRGSTRIFERTRNTSVCPSCGPEDFQHDRIYGTVRAVNPFHEGAAQR